MLGKEEIYILIYLVTVTVFCVWAGWEGLI